MHKANNERAELQRKLEAQSKVKVDDDDDGDYAAQKKYR